MGASQLGKTTASVSNYRGLGRAVGRSQIQADLYFKKAATKQRRIGRGNAIKTFPAAVRRFHSIQLHSSAYGRTSLHFLLLRFGLFGITGFENGDDIGPVSGPFTALLWDEKSIDPEDVRDEKKIELITLHNAMRKLGMDYSAVVNPLLAD
jgi:hypothetical protein